MQRGSVLPLLLVLILILTVGVGVFYIQFYRTDTTSEAAVAIVPIKTKTLSSPSPAKQVSSIESLGLSFEVPEGFSLKEETEEEYFKRAFGNIRKNFSGYVLYSPAEFAESFYIVADGENNLDKSILTVWAFQNPESLDPKAFYNKYWYYPFVWGDFSAKKNNIAPESIELIDGKEGQFGVVDFREEKPKFIYLPLNDKNLMLQIQYPNGSLTAKEILRSFKFE